MGRTDRDEQPLWPFLRQLLLETSRTFAMGIEVLPAGLRQEVTVAYLVLRVSDYLEDNEAMADKAKVEALAAWAAILRGEEELSALAPHMTLDPGLLDSRAAANADAVLRGLACLGPEAHDIIVRHTADSTEGMARWVRRGPDFPAEADLDDYMHEVAGRVGYLLTELFAVRYPGIARMEGALMPLAREFGLALQTVNVIRGLSSDHRRGWVFVPTTFLPPETDFPHLLNNPASGPALALLDRLIDKAERHLQAAQTYVQRLPRHLFGIRVFCLLPLFLAVRTASLSRSNPDVFTAEVKVPRPTVRAIAARSRLLWFSNGWIRRYGARLTGPA